MEKDKNFIDRHHIIPQSRGWSNHHHNLIDIIRKKHEAIHCLFDVDLPDEQITKIISMYGPAWTKSFRKDIIDVLLDNKDKYYINEVRKK